MSPVQRAFAAVVVLTPEERAFFVARVNSTMGQLTPPLRIEFHEGEK